jgi:leader peptidase (prepilin peptidase)/N-methyltransferase
MLHRKMTSFETREQIESAESLQPNLAVLIGGGIAIGLVSIVSLPVPVAIASTLLGILMVAGADVDARTYLLPNLITWGAIISGVIAAWFLDELDPWQATSDAILRAMCAAGLLALLRSAYSTVRHREGLGFGDVKLAAAVGAWLPLNAIPLCFGLATAAALVTILWGLVRGKRVEKTMKIPLGAFLCPALWFVFFASNLPTG